jgi:AcrR family transcriptional regulator
MKSGARTRDPDAKLAALHEAAFTLLAGQPYQAVSVSMIAARAGVAIGTFYRFYPTKMALLEAMSDHLEQEFVKEMREAWAKADNYSEKIANLSGALFQTIAARQAEIGVMQMTAGHRTADSIMMGDVIRQEIARLYDDGVKNGGFEHHNPQDFAAAAHGIVEGLMRQYFAEATLPKQRHLVQLLTSMLIKLAARQ